MSAPCLFDIYVVDGFILTEFAGVVEVLRLANRINGSPIFEWQIRSASGGMVRASSGVIVDSTPIPTRPEADYLFVIGNSDPDCPALSLGPALATYTSRQARVVLLSEAASRYITENAGKPSNHTTHWENRTVLLEQLGLFDTKATLAVESGAIITCAGMSATFDITLSIASQHASPTTMATVADILLHERVRHFNTLQPFSGKEVTTTGDSALDACLALMKDNMEFPLPISEIAEQTTLSKRSLERKFNRLLNATPNSYYRGLRLHKANNLLLNTDMRINEIGLACGFPSGFTTIYREAFGMTPNAARKKGRLK
ncbi:transcriptional regulator GlxA family with amidase domain [Yoonia maricola]|uniref:Transcriptional regulator GlxA family with amidase domain n=1 Tax=Yoonia maricola TaxID=420999 RepID=A0A2M8WQ67_9RHOB|nr:helix-turn-helix domain-containing protein [Yoonia maricola]PJI93054.1 transcriptional regulator GlxA family with amidase domain [Yoonia maricola]